ncbi:MAG: tetratricopeptide repeat protein [Planctomycetes bacterium]|nr:tetratricopeptide repeat protein [Planctomycetota bacterium]
MTAGQEATRRAAKWTRVCGALFILGTVVIFLPCWSAATFITHEESILRLPILSHWRNLPTIFSQEFMIYSDGLYRPFSYAVLAVLRTFIPAQAAGLWHALLIGLHLADTLLIFAIVKRLVRHVGAAALAAAAFGFHPLASVVANDMNHFFILLSVTFYLCSLFGYIAYRDREGPAPLIFAIIMFSVGLLASPIVATLPIVLMVYEWLYRRRGLRKSLPVLLPFLVLTAVAIWSYTYLHPHLVLYSYKAVEGSAWPSFFTIVAGGYRCALGLALGRQIPVVLLDMFTRIYTWENAGFLIGAAASIVLLGLALWMAWRREAAGLGLIVIFTTLIPFASTAWNPVTEYVSWSYLYAPLVGLALIVGGLADRLLPLRGSRERAVGLLLLVLIVGQYGLRLYRINSVTRTPVAYWEHVLALAPRSGSAQVELGRAYLAEGRVDEALRCLFTRDVPTLDKSCEAMCRYYLREGNVLAAMIHAEFADNTRTQAAIFEHLHVPDHAESRLGQALSRDKFDTDAMKSLARVLAEKGYVPDARRWLQCVIETDPSDAEARELLAEIGKPQVKAPVAAPSRADWIRFLVSREMSPRLREEVLDLSERIPNDPVIQIRAAYCLLVNGAFAPSLDKFARLFARLSSVSPLAAIFSWGLTQSGDADRAIAVAEKALDKNPRSAELEYTLGLALARKGQFREAILHYSKALSIRPGVPAIHYYMGMALMDLERPREAAVHFEHVLQKKPDHAESHAALANALTELDQFAGAIAHYTKAARLDPGNPGVQKDWAVACYRQGRYAEAWAHVRACRKLSAEPEPEFVAKLQAKMPEPKP